LALPDNYLIQPLQMDNTVPPQLLPPSFQCGKLDAGAMRPPGMWDGGVSGWQYHQTIIDFVLPVEPCIAYGMHSMGSKGAALGWRCDCLALQTLYCL
jgi:hypothetical protein